MTDHPDYLHLEVLQVRMHLWRNVDGSLGAGIAPPEGASRLAQAIAEFRIPVQTPSREFANEDSALVEG